MYLVNMLLLPPSGPLSPIVPGSHVSTGINSWTTGVIIPNRMVLLNAGSDRAEASICFDQGPNSVPVGPQTELTTYFQRGKMKRTKQTWAEGEVLFDRMTNVAWSDRCFIETLFPLKTTEHRRQVLPTSYSSIPYVLVFPLMMLTVVLVDKKTNVYFYYLKKWMPRAPKPWAVAISLEPCVSQDYFFCTKKYCHFTK